MSTKGDFILLLVIVGGCHKSIRACDRTCLNCGAILTSEFNVCWSFLMFVILLSRGAKKEWRNPFFFYVKIEKKKERLTDEREERRLLTATKTSAARGRKSEFKEMQKLLF